MSTAILQLSENGDLQRIHDKWLTRSSCSSESAEVESDRLHLKSFWGLFLMFAIVCIIALSVYFVQIVNQSRRASNYTTDSVSDARTSSRSGQLRRFFSLFDEKLDPSHGRNKRRKIERSLSDSNIDSDFGKNRYSIATGGSIDSTNQLR